jgi:hypothetical protein
MADPDTTDQAGAPSSIEEANIANILAKLKAGKILSEREEKRLRQYQDRETARAAGKPTAADLAEKVADSMDQAAALTGIPKDRLQRAKSAGCPAFRGSRVYVEELVEWLEENADTLPTGNDELDRLNVEIAREKLRRARFSQDVEESRYTKNDDTAAKLLALGLTLKNTLIKRCVDEYPDKLAHRPREEIVGIMRALVDEICLDFSKGIKK